MLDQWYVTGRLLLLVTVKDGAVSGENKTKHSFCDNVVSGVAGGGGGGDGVVNFWLLTSGKLSCWPALLAG